MFESEVDKLVEPIMHVAQLQQIWKVKLVCYETTDKIQGISKIYILMVTIACPTLVSHTKFHIQKPTKNENENDNELQFAA